MWALVREWLSPSSRILAAFLSSGRQAFLPATPASRKRRANLYETESTSQTCSNACPPSNLEADQSLLQLEQSTLYEFDLLRRAHGQVYPPGLVVP
jgi:hypothetical protein